MNTDILLYMLRDRLRTINERIGERQQMSERSYEHRVFCDGAQTELESERLWLRLLIAQIEREGVTP